MFGISFLELIVIFIVAFLVLGPDKLQEFAKSLGNFISNINNFSSNVKDEINVSLNPNLNNLNKKDKETNDFKKINKSDIDVSDIKENKKE
ncbi:MAG: Sec-independent protein translocase subunit TatA/TatB [Bdellovibrionota bacterium]